jgi:large subunit ribosomal protein L34e
MRKNKSRTYRRVNRRVPGGRTSLHLKKRKPSKAHCASCGSVLKGVLRERPFKMKNTPKSMKRPERPFGGQLCSSCSRSIFIQKARIVGNLQ